MEKFTFKQWRSVKGFTLAEMAKKMNLSVIAYRNKEIGNTRFYLDEADLFVKIVGITLDNIER